jgi:hypothetical protein
VPTLTLRISEEAFRVLQENAEKSMLSVTDFVLSKTIPSYLLETLTIDKVLEKLKEEDVGTIVSLKDLFSSEEWGGFSAGSRIATGRLFFQAYEKNQYNLKKLVKFMGKNSANLAIYKKLSD